MAQSAMLKEERHQQILNILYASGKVNVEELTRVFGCSHDTMFPGNGRRQALMPGKMWKRMKSIWWQGRL